MSIKITCPKRSCQTRQSVPQPFPLPGSTIQCIECGQKISMTYPKGAIDKLRTKGIAFQGDESVSKQSKRIKVHNSGRKRVNRGSSKDSQHRDLLLNRPLFEVILKANLDGMPYHYAHRIQKNRMQTMNTIEMLKFLQSLKKIKKRADQNVWLRFRIVFFTIVLHIGRGFGLSMMFLWAFMTVVFQLCTFGLWVLLILGGGFTLLLFVLAILSENDDAFVVAFGSGMCFMAARVLVHIFATIQQFLVNWFLWVSDVFSSSELEVDRLIFGIEWVVLLLSAFYFWGSWKVLGAIVLNEHQVWTFGLFQLWSMMLSVSGIGMLKWCQDALYGNQQGLQKRIQDVDKWFN